MNKIQITANKETNYVFHMLSVCKCGYDNAYGAKYRPLYPAEDLAVLKRNESLLTVSGGEHCGALYGLITSACAYPSAKQYFDNLLRVSREIARGKVPPYVNGSTLKHNDTVIRICEIMIKHYDHYAENIWRREKEEIELYIPELFDMFEKTRFSEKAEKLVGICLENGFTASLVNSIDGGAEAINISNGPDVFGIGRSHSDAFHFIAHEFVIYLLMQALKDTDAFENFSTWTLTEGLAEYYTKKLTGRLRFFDKQKRYVEFYEQISKDKDISAIELYSAALKRFGA